MNDYQQAEFDPKLYAAWRNLAAAILNPHYNPDTQTDAQQQAKVQ